MRKNAEAYHYIRLVSIRCWFVDAWHTEARYECANERGASVLLPRPPFRGVYPFGTHFDEEPINVRVATNKITDVEAATVGAALAATVTVYAVLCRTFVAGI